MSFLESITIPRTPMRTPIRQRTGGFLDRISLPQDQVRATKVFGVRQEAFKAQKELEELSGLGGIVKETGKDIFKKTKGAVTGAFSNIFQTFEQFPSKVVEDVRGAIPDIKRSFDVNRPLIPRIKDALKGLVKAPARVAGDIAITLFSPISAAIGAALELTQGQKLIDKTGQVIADKSGITNLEAFQKFAIEHPNAGEDFDRFLFLALVGLGGFKGRGAKTKQFDPIRLKNEVKTFVDKLIASEPQLQPITTKPKVKGGFLESVVKPEVKTEVKTELGEKVFRTSEKPFDPKLAGKEGVFVSPSEFVAESFGGKVKETLFISPDAKILKASEVPKRFTEFEGKDVQKVQQELADFARKKGFDVIEVSEIERQIINLNVLKTKTQLDIEVPAEKPSKVALSIEERVIEQKLAEGFEGLAGFDPITIKQQARLVSELIAKDLERAKRMVRGEEPVPDNLRGSSLIVGLEEHALKIGDVALLRDLAKSPLTSKTSRSAQELRILAERTPESPVRVIADVGKVRESALEGRTKKKISEVKKTDVNAIKTEIKKGSTKRQGWEEFIKEIKCK